MSTHQSATHGLPSAALSFSGGRMEFVTHNTKEIKIDGSHLQGYIDAGYSELTDLFGEPHNGDGYKSDAEWSIEFADGTVATIYNYKDGHNYNDGCGTPTEAIRNWHIGGFTKQALNNVQIMIDLKREDEEPKPETEAEAAFETAIEMMEMLRKTKGMAYADTVEAMMLTKKRCDLLVHLVAGLVHSELMPEDAAKAIMQIDGMLSSKIMNKMFKHTDIKGEKAIQEAIGWSKRLMEYEKIGAEAIIKEHMKGRDDE